MDELLPPCSLSLRLRAWIRRSATAVALRPLLTGVAAACAEAIASPARRGRGRYSSGLLLAPVLRLSPLPLLDEAEGAALRVVSLPRLAGDEAKVALLPPWAAAKGEKEVARCSALVGTGEEESRLASGLMRCLGMEVAVGLAATPGDRSAATRSNDKDVAEDADTATTTPMKGRSPTSSPSLTRQRVPHLGM
ncbi:Os04g0645800 [Oryza sativa Japonica Group]|uniref:Os04g0645800 protein n=1 Tax=Oryza sativa subsp. japonica TaxID=39947 RepID=A0A0P0WFR1_ORYSJ|nr:Os04g0645800 [Oryza sativa Japonica Group]